MTYTFDMSPEQIESILRTLNRNQLKILYLKCHGKTYLQIKFEFERSIEWVGLRMKEVYEKFGMDDPKIHHTIRDNILKERICPIFEEIYDGKDWNDKQEVIEDPKPDLEPVPDPTSPGWIVVWQDMALENTKQDNDIIVIPPIISEPSGNGKITPWWVKALVILAGIGLLLFTGYYLGGGLNRPATPLPEENTPIITVEPIVITEEPIEEAAAIILPTHTVSLPTSTLTPTQTSTPTPTPLFFDPFTGGVSNIWAISGDNYNISDGALSSLGKIHGVVGDTTWSDYVVEFNLNYLISSNYENGFNIIIRRLDDSNYMLLQISTRIICSARWVIINNGQKRVVVDSEVKIDNNWRACPGVWKIEAIGNTFTTIKNFEVRKQFIDDTFASGGSGLLVNGDQTEFKLDYFKVDLP